MDQPIKDKRLRPYTLKGTPFTWQDTRIMKIIREFYCGEKRTTAIAIYQTLTELASLAGRGQGKHVSQFNAHQITIAEKAGKSISTIKRYAKDFEFLGIISKQPLKMGKMNRASLWKLHDYDRSYSEPTPSHNKDPYPLAHNNKPATEEDRIKFINKKERFNKFKSNDGFKSIGDILK